MNKAEFKALFEEKGIMAALNVIPQVDDQHWIKCYCFKATRKPRTNFEEVLRQHFLHSFSLKFEIWCIWQKLKSLFPKKEKAIPPYYPQPPFIPRCKVGLVTGVHYECGECMKEISETAYSCNHCGVVFTSDHNGHLI